MASGADWKFEHRVLSLAKMGFRRHEAEAALRSSASGEVMAHDTLCRLLEPFRSPGDGPGVVQWDRAVEEAARDEEASALGAIFGEEAFRSTGGGERGTGAGGGLRWEVDTTLEFDDGGVLPETTVGVVFEDGKR